ncbi:hypothetical protein L1049_027081 [Liquidambar formosana]|uniref:Uncharacterized protein n=1 Tax=Liquidambar formosana TaxID=63359 RepID=A0AAP0N2M5_LIQFO
MCSRGDFEVSVSKKEVVTAVMPSQEHWLPLSNLDLLIPPIDVGVFFCYKKPLEGADNSTFESMVSVLKKALAQVLVPYYVFSGEVVPNSLGEPELLCNNRGAEFMEAFAQVELRDINSYNPDESVQGKLVPKKNKGVLSVQATELKCGGLVVACSFDHRVADAHSTNMFLVSWAEKAQSKPLSILPCHRLSLLSPRRPGHYDPSLDNMYVPTSALPPPKEHQPGADHLISRIYYIAANQLGQLQSMASSGSRNRTKLESFSAFLWKMVAKYAVRQNVDKKIGKLGIAIDGRSRLSHGEGDDKAALMAAYFGNVLSNSSGEMRIHELNEKPLSLVADTVHDYLERAMTKEHFLGLIDWVEAHRPKPAAAKILSGGSNDGTAIMVSSGLWFPASKVDFGWGRAAFWSYHFPSGGSSAGYVMPMPSPAGNGDWVVFMHSLKGQLEFIEAEAAHLFKPLTSDYLNLVPNVTTYQTLDI